MTAVATIQSAGRHVVGMAEAAVSDVPGSVLVTHALGSCLGIAAHDAHAGVGGLLHVMMPTSSINPDRARTNPYAFVDTGVPRFFRDLYALGAAKGRLVVKVAGGAAIGKGDEDRFAIGKRNFIVLKKIFWQNGVLIEASDVGGDRPRTMRLEVGSGLVVVSTAGNDFEL